MSHLKFVYKDEISNLLKPSEECADVFIALHNGTMAKPWTGQVAQVPYASSVSLKSIESWYRSRGARDVHITVLSNTDMDSMIAKVRAFLKADNRFKAVSAERLIELYDKGNRFLRYLKMFYLRHVAFQKALEWARYGNRSVVYYARWFCPLNTQSLALGQRAYPTKLTLIGERIMYFLLLLT